MKPYKIAFLISHPIQYNSPLFKKIAGEPGIDLTVYYCSGEGVEKIKDKEFGRQIAWDIPLLDGYRYKFLKNYSILPTVSLAPFGLLNPGIAAELNKNRYDALIVHGWHYLTHWIAFAAAFSLKIPVILRSEMPLSQELLKPERIISLKKIILTALFGKISGFLAIGTENREFYKYYGVPDTKIFMAPYSVDNERFLSENEKLKADRESFRKKLGIPRDAAVILFAGKLIPKKRPADLLKAYKTLSSAGKAVIFVGDGILRKELASFAADNKLENVFFAGFKNQTEIGRYYSAADIFVLPSGIGETWGLAVNEAMCFGLPVIVSDLAGCGTDLVADGINGYIFKTGDIAALSGFIEKVLNNSALRSVMGKASLERIKNWSYNEDVEGIMAALRTLPLGSLTV